MQIILENSALWLLPIILVSALAAWLLYFKSKSFNKGQRAFLSAIRFFIFFLIGILLLSPLLKSSERREEKPILVWMEDHARSMVLANDSETVKSVFANEDLLADLEEMYTVEKLDFGKSLTAASDSFNSPSTNLYEALNGVQERFYNQNVGGVVILSDGISNSGNNPAYAAQNITYPLFSMGFGDTTSSADMLIDRVVHNNVSYLNNNFPVEIYLKARELEGGSYTVSIADNSGKKLFSQNKSIKGNDYFERIDLFINAEKVGLQRFTVNVTPVGTEENLNNNTRGFTVDVLNNRKKVHIMGTGPHPDMGAIANALKSVEKYEVETFISTNLPEASAKADLYILHDPNAALLEKYASGKNSVWIFQGPTTPISELKKYGGVTAGSNSFEEVQAEINTAFNLFTLSEDEIDFTVDLPPLWSAFGKAEAVSSIYPLFYKRVGSVVTTDPIWFYAQESDKRKAFTLGTGIWKWRIEDYRKQKNFARFDALVYKSVQYLTTNKQERRFVIDIAGRFDQSEPIRAEARLYNSSLELTNEPDLKVTFTNEQNQSFDFSFSRAQNTYRLNAGRLAAGVYTFNATITLGDETFKQAGSFVVEQSLLEETDLVARHQLLRNLSSESGGEFFKGSQLEKLKQELLNNTAAKSIQTLETSTSSLINERWIFAIFLVLMALEWGLRKYFGNY